MNIYQTHAEALEMKQEIMAKAGESFGGTLTRNDAPEPTSNTWYFAQESGTYPNAGGLIIDTSSNLTVVIYKNGQWSKVEIDTPDSGGGGVVDFDSLTPEQKEELSFKFSDFTLEQLDQLKMKFEDLTTEEKAEITGPAGPALTFDQLTTPQINQLKQPAIDAAAIATTATTQANEARDNANTAATNANEAKDAANAAAASVGGAITNANNAANEALAARDAANQAAENALTGISGEATTSTVPSATGFERYIVHQAGTYTNFIDGTATPIVVTASDLDVVNGVANNRVILEVQDGVATKRVERVKGDAGAAKIPTWTPKTFASGSQVFHLGTIYESNKNTNLEPSLNSNDWNIISREVVDSDNLLEFTDANGNILGSFDKFGNWIVKEIKEVKENPIINERLTEYKYFVFTNQEDQVIAEIDNTGKLTVNELEVRKEFNDKSKSSDSGSNELEITSETFVRLERPKFMRLEVKGFMPTDNSETRTPTNVEVTMKDGTNVLLKFNAKLAIQGTGSATYLKKGYSIDLSNKDNAALKIKIGDMVTESSYHLKAFHTDITHTRDVGNSRLWAEMIATRPFPKNLVKPLENTLLPLEQYNEKNIFLEDAKFYPDGIPCEIILNGVFYGLYTFRLKKTRENYKVNNLNENHIFIENMYTGVFMGIETYTSWADIEPKWEVRSPKTMTPTAKANILRMLNFWRASMTGTYLRDNYADYIVLDSWIDFIITAELVDHRDVAGNNTLLLTHDGQHWNINLYDTDNSIGIYGTLTNATNAFLITVDIWAKFKSTFEAEIKARYTELRNKGVISNANFKKIYGGISENIPSSVYKENYINWGCQTTNAIPTMQHLYKFLNDRMVWLDTQWKV